MAQVVIDAGLHLGEVDRLRDALNVEKLGDGPQVGEPVRKRSGTHAREAVLKVQARRQDVQGNLNASHFA